MPPVPGRERSGSGSRRVMLNQNTPIEPGRAPSPSPPRSPAPPTPTSRSPSPNPHSPNCSRRRMLREDPARTFPYRELQRAPKPIQAAFTNADDVPTVRGRDYGTWQVPVGPHTPPPSPRTPVPILLAEGSPKLLANKIAAAMKAGRKGWRDIKWLETGKKDGVVAGEIAIKVVAAATGAMAVGMGVVLDLPVGAGGRLVSDEYREKMLVKTIVERGRRKRVRWGRSVKG